MKTQKKPRKQRAGKTALVVDDNPLIRRLIVDTLLGGGFGVCVEASNGKEALALARKFKPHIITLDLSMPVMNGLEAASNLRKILPKTPIILITMHADTLSDHEVSKAGISLVLSKTDSLSTLVQKARKLMRS